MLASCTGLAARGTVGTIPARPAIVAVDTLAPVADTVGQGALSAALHTLAADSAFQAELRAGRKTDTTLLDRIKALYIDALHLGARYQFTGNKDELMRSLELLNRSIKLQDSLRVPYPRLYAAAAFRLGQFYLNTSNYQAAYSLTAGAHRFDPDNCTYLEYLALLNESSDNAKMHREAIAQFEQLARRRPGNSVYRLHLFSLYSKARDERNALRAIEAYERLEGESVITLNYRIALCRQMNREADIEAEIRSYISRNPADRPAAELTLSNVLLTRGRNDEAFHLLNRNLGYIDNYDLDKLLNPYVATMLEAHDTARVYHFADTLCRVNPDDEDIPLYVARVAAKLRDTALVVSSLRQARLINPGNEQACQQLLEIYAAREQIDSIIPLAAECYSLFGTDNWAYFHIISTAQRAFNSHLAADNDTMLAVCRRVIARGSNNYVRGVAYMCIGDYYNELDSMARSFENYDSCLRYDPDNSGVLNNYAYRLVTLPGVTADDLTRAERMAARALKVDPASAPVLDTYAWILYLSGDAVSARLYMDKLLRLAAETGSALSAEEYYHLWRIYAALGLTTEADGYLTQARCLYRANPASVTLPEVIDALK